MIDALFNAIRKSLPPPSWSVGVQLARDNSVTGQADEGDEITLRVISGSGRRAYEVTLWPEDEDWQCDCPEAEANDTCGHIAAAVIALRQARRDGKPLPTAERQVARLRYELRRVGSGLNFQRVLDDGARVVAWNSGVTTQGKAAIFTVDGDRVVEQAMGTWRSGAIPAQVMTDLLTALAEVDVTLDGAPISVSGQPVTPVAVVRDHEPGFLLELVPAPGLREMFANRAVLIETDGELELRPVGSGGLTERELRELPRGRYYRPEDASDLITDILPELARRIPVTRQTKRLPTGKVAAPRVVLEVGQDEDMLTVFPTLVYGDPPVARIDGGTLVLLGGELPLRDPRAENQLITRLTQGLGLQPGRRTALHADQAVSFVRKLDNFSLGDVVGDAHERYFLAPPLDGDIGFDEGGGLSVNFHSEGQRADPSRVLQAWHRGQSLAPLDDGGFAPLPRDWLARYGPAIVGLLDAKRDDGTVPTAAFGDVLQLCDALGQPAPPRFEALRALLADFSGIPRADLPADLTATLRGYQEQGVDWLAFLRDAGMGGLLADDMGLGKTLQALVAVRGRTLVVAPTSVLHNWAKEAATFRPGLSVNVYHGAKRALDPTADLTLTTYALMRLDLDVLKGVRWDTAILDEAQAIKNPDSQVARAAHALNAEFRITLTGTPVENRLDDLWSQLHFANPGILGSRKDFKERFVDPITNGEGGAAAALRQRIKPFILRRLKRDVAPELPPRTDLVLRCELSTDERAVYEAIRLTTQKEIVARLSGGGNVIAALEALLRLRQASCHRALIPGQTVDPAVASSKIAVLMDLLDEAVAEDHKALVFSQWTGLLDLVEPHLRAHDLPFVRLDGSTRDRGAVVDAFQADDGPPIMLISLKAGGTGLNLTAADHVVLMDPWWNPAVEDQAADRAHRIGQERPVFVHRIVAQDTVEERILALQQSKRALAEAAIGDAAQAAGLSRDDLLSLLA